MHPLPIRKTDDPFDSDRILTVHPDARRKRMAGLDTSPTDAILLVGFRSPNK
jgi:hypothetical protein